MKRHKVLVVEDNPSNLELFLELLGMIDGIDAVSAGDGVSAMRLARDESPRLILLDIQLPGMDGVSILKEFKKDPITSNIPVVALTAYAMKGDAERFIVEGFDDYIPKPVHVEEFLRVVKKHI